MDKIKKYISIFAFLSVLLLFNSKLLLSQYKYDFDFNKNWEWLDLFISDATLSNSLLPAVRQLSEEYTIDEGRILFKTLVNLDSLNQIRLLPAISGLDPSKNKTFRRYIIEKELLHFNERDNFRGLIEAAQVVTKIRNNFSPNRRIFNDRKFYLKTIDKYDTNTVINFDIKGAVQILDLVTKDSLTSDDYRNIDLSPYLNMVYNTGKYVCTSKGEFKKSLYYARRKEPILILYKFLNPSSFLNMGYISVYASNYRKVISTILTQSGNIKFYIVNLLSQFFPKGARFNVLVDFLFGYENCNWNSHSNNLPLNLTQFGDDYEFLSKYLIRGLFGFEKDNTIIDIFPYLFKGSDTLILQVMKEVFEGGISNYIAPILAENRPAALLEKDFLLFKSTIYAILQNKKTSVIDSLLSLGRDNRFLFYTMGTQMASSIDKALGRYYITKSLTDGPISFFKIYEQAYAVDSKQIRDIFQFRAEFEKKVEEMNSVIDKQMYNDFIKLKSENKSGELLIKNIEKLNSKYDNRNDKYIFNLLAGQLLYMVDLYDKSFEYFDKALPYVPDKIKTVKEIAKLYLDDEANEAAIKMYSKYIEYAPQNPDSYLNRADVYYLINNFTKAKVDYEKVLQYQPDNKYVIAKLNAINTELQRTKN